MAKLVENDDLLDLAMKATAEVNKQSSRILLDCLEKELTPKGVWEDVRKYIEDIINALTCEAKISDNFYFTLLHLHTFAKQKHGNENPILFHLDGMETTIALFTSDEDFADELGFDGEEITDESNQEDGFFKD